MSDGAAGSSRKRLGPVAWVAIGCVALGAVAAAALLAAGMFVTDKLRDVAAELEENPAMVAAETIVRLNPELELVSKDEAGQRLTIRHTGTGRQVTLDVEQIRQGKISFETDEGSATLEVDTESGRPRVVATTDEGTMVLGPGGRKLPAWVPAYPDLAIRESQRSSIPQGEITVFSVETDDPLERVFDFFRQGFASAGYEVQAVDLDGLGKTLIAVAPDKTRKASMNFRQEQATTRGTITCNEARP